MRMMRMMWRCGDVEMWRCGDGRDEDDEKMVDDEGDKDDEDGEDGEDDEMMR